MKAVVREQGIWFKPTETPEEDCQVFFDKVWGLLGDKGFEPEDVPPVMIMDVLIGATSPPEFREAIWEALDEVDHYSVNEAKLRKIIVEQSETFMMSTDEAHDPIPFGEHDVDADTSCAKVKDSFPQAEEARLECDATTTTCGTAAGRPPRREGDRPLGKTL